MKILTVEIKKIQPKTAGSWKSPMQVIETDEGVYIDNLPGTSFGPFPRGHDWSKHIGKNIDNLNTKIRHSSGYEWLNLN